MRKICLLLLCTVLLLSGCSENSRNKLTDEFNNHLKNHYEYTNGNTQQLMFSSKNLKFCEADLEIEKVEYGTYHIIATMGNMLNNPHDQIWTISAKELKQEMRDFAETVIVFAKEKNMDNDYYLYVQIYSSTMVSFVYDYEEDVLYIPQKYELYCEMFSTFGTTNDYKISETEEGLKWLVENGFGEIKHHEYESFSDYSSPRVYLNDNGEFNSYNLSWCECCR